MRDPNPRDFEDRADYEAAVNRYEAWADSEIDFQRDARAEVRQQEEAIAKVWEDHDEEKFERAWENWCAENFRKEN